MEVTNDIGGYGGTRLRIASYFGYLKASTFGHYCSIAIGLFGIFYSDLNREEMEGLKR